MLERLRASRPQPLAMDRNARVARVTDLSQRLLIDMARLGYGEQPKLEYMPELLADALRGVYERYRRTAWLVESDFGEIATASAQLIEDEATPVRVELVLDDRSAWCHRTTGERRPAQPTTWRVRLTLDAACVRVVAMSLERG